MKPLGYILLRIHNLFFRDRFLNICTDTISINFLHPLEKKEKKRKKEKHPFNHAGEIWMGSVWEPFQPSDLQVREQVGVAEHEMCLLRKQYLSLTGHGAGIATTPKSAYIKACTDDHGPEGVRDCQRVWVKFNVIFTRVRHLSVCMSYTEAYLL